MDEVPGGVLNAWACASQITREEAQAWQHDIDHAEPSEDTLNPWYVTDFGPEYEARMT